MLRRRALCKRQRNASLSLTTITTCNYCHSAPPSSQAQRAQHESCEWASRPLVSSWSLKVFDSPSVSSRRQSSSLPATPGIVPYLEHDADCDHGGDGADGDPKVMKTRAE
ncbi:hypothetical protein IW262DRAFT_1486970 [Armillaria fumosa]|nr:hypothetical protein IW262DRAFT_1486970 [Armillaria fumosa]